MEDKSHSFGDGDEVANADRREFLRRSAKYAAITPPAVTFLLSTTLSTEAVARSGGHHKKKVRKRSFHKFLVSKKPHHAQRYYLIRKLRTIFSYWS